MELVLPEKNTLKSSLEFIVKSLSHDLGTQLNCYRRNGQKLAGRTEWCRMCLWQLGRGEASTCIAEIHSLSNLTKIEGGGRWPKNTTNQVPLPQPGGNGRDSELSLHMELFQTSFMTLPSKVRLLLTLELYS